MSTPAGATPEGAATAAEGTPVAVDLSQDRRARRVWAVLLAGPVIWAVHFGLVYLVAEAGCTGDGTGLDVFDPPVPRAVSVGATVVAAACCVAVAWYARRVWRGLGSADDAALHGRFERDPGAPLAQVGFLLAAVSAVAVLAVGVPAPFVPPC